MKTSKADNKKVKDIIRKAKGLSRKQAEILATIPPNVLYTLINTMSQLVSQNEPELKEGKLVARAREQVSFVLKKLEDEHAYLKKKVAELTKDRLKDRSSESKEILTRLKRTKLMIKDAIARAKATLTK